MSETLDPQYDAFYYQNCCGQPHERNEQLLGFFDAIAEKIVRTIQPKSVLDVGCAMGMLVEKLRDRGVDAFGVDVSEYAIGQAREDIQPFLAVGSILEPFAHRCDLVVCMEVVEHLPAAHADTAIANLCQVSDDILFASSPLDFREATHFNVRPPEYWAERFAGCGLFHDVEYDASFVMPWAMRFRRSTEPVPRLIVPFERALWLQTQQIQGLRATIAEGRESAVELKRLEEQHRKLMDEHVPLVRDHIALIEDQKHRIAHAEALERELAALKRNPLRLVSMALRKRTGGGG